MVDFENEDVDDFLFESVIVASGSGSLGCFQKAPANLFRRFAVEADPSSLLLFDTSHVEGVLIFPSFFANRDIVRRVNAFSTLYDVLAELSRKGTLIESAYACASAFGTTRSNLSHLLPTSRRLGSVPAFLSISANQSLQCRKDSLLETS